MSRRQAWAEYERLWAKFAAAKGAARKRLARRALALLTGGAR